MLITMKKNYFKTIAIVSLLFVGFTSSGQETTLIFPDALITCDMPDTGEPNDTFIALRASAEARMASRENPCATIDVTYNNFPSAIPSGPGPQQVAFQLAVDIWETLIESPVTIKIDAEWVDTGNPNNLGGAGPIYFGELPGNTDNVIYPAPLYDALIGFDASPLNPDIFCRFNSARTDWFFPTSLTDDAPPGTFNFTTVVFHELGHGLGMLGLAQQSGVNGYIRRLPSSSYQPGNPDNVHVSPWDTFIETAPSQISILDTSQYPDPSPQLLSQFTGNNLNCNAPTAVQQNMQLNPGIPLKTYAPFSFAPGSSYSHWDEATFNGSETALMTPFLGPGEDIYDPGNVTLGFMEDMGWVLCQGSLSTEEFTFSQVEISPNPFTSRIDINIANGFNDDYTVSLIDINGRKVFTQLKTAVNGNLNIDNLTSLEDGLYFLTITNERSDLSVTKKLIKN